MDQIQAWEAVGDAWVTHAAEIDAHGVPVTEALLAAIGDVSGQRVLDVGCGTGTLTTELIARGAAAAVGIDLSAPMIERAKQRVADGPATIAFEVADASTYTDESQFDLVTSRMGVMFFPDPVAAFDHLHELAGPGGRLVVATWRDPFSNPWMMVPMMASVPVLGPPDLPGPGEPGPFSLADSDRIIEVLGAAGWSDVDVDVIEFERASPGGGAGEAAALSIDVNPMLAAAVAARPEVADELRDALTAAFADHERDGRVVMAAAANIATARA